FVNLALSCVFGVFVLMSVLRSLPSTLPISCVWEIPARPFPSNAATSIAGTIAVIAGNCAVFGLSVWYLHLPHFRWLKAIQIVGLMVLMASGIGAAIRVILLAQAFGQPSVRLNNEAE